MGYPRSSVYARETHPLRTAPRLILTRRVTAWTNTKSTSARIRASSWRKAIYYSDHDEVSAASAGHTPMPGHATSAQAAASPQSYISSSCQRNQRALSPRAGVQMGGSAGSRHPLGFQIRYVNFADRIAPAFRWFFAIPMQPRTHAKAE